MTVKTVISDSTKLGDNLVDAVANIDGQLDQLIAELADNEPAQNRARSIKNALAQIAPGKVEEPEA